MVARVLLAAVLTLCLIAVDSFGTTMDVYFTHPYGGIYKRDADGVITAVLPDIGRCTGLEFDDLGNLYFGRFYDDNHKIDLMRMSPDYRVTNLGRIVQVGSVVLSVDIDIAASKEGDIYFTHPSGGVFKKGSTPGISVVLPDVGIVGSLEFGNDRNLYLSRYYDDFHRSDLLMMPPDDHVVDLGDIVQVTSITHAFDIDLAVNAAGDVYFTNPYGGIYMMSSSGQVSTVLPDVGRCTGITFGENGDLYFGRWYDDRHRINLMMMSADRNLTDLGIIVQIGSVVLRWDEDIAVIPEPATLLLFGVGGLMLRRRRQA